MVKIVNASGTSQAEYSYNAWGQVISATGTLAAVNPIRYRGYYYDKESGLYYLKSRYYDPEICRFINADGLSSTGQGFLGCNLFAYCGNNPINRTDLDGLFWKELWEAFSQAVQQSSSSLAFAGVVTQLDSPVPGPADVIGAVLAGSVLITCFCQALDTTLALPAPSLTFPQIKADTETGEKETSLGKDIAIPSLKKKQVIFPKDPYLFNPIGLQMVVRPGTKNGKIISWMGSGKREVFRWDENPNFPNGSHYHIYGQGHYIPGIDAVPEPYSTVYFPFG